MFKIVFCCLGLAAFSIAIEKQYYNLERADELFSNFIITHGKIYTNDEEKQKRYETFQENLKVINHLNSVSESVLGITKFIDLTTEEFLSKYTGLRRPTSLEMEDDDGRNCETNITDIDITTKEAPSSWDWREKNVVTPVKNQNPCESCWAFSTTGTVEGRYALKTGKLISLSEQEVMDCVEGPYGGHCENGGYMISALNYISKNLGGLESESDYPYVAHDLKCQADPTKIKVKINGCINFRLTDEEKLKEALYKYGPIAITIDATFWNFHTDTVFKNCNYFQLNHAVLLVGYGSEGGDDYWLIKNSWGTGFAEKGYIRISRGKNCGGLLNNDATVAVVA